MKSWEIVFKKCGWKCVYCGASLAGDFRLYQSSCEDHLVPKTEKKQGLDGEENLVAACHTCNSFKRDWELRNCSLIKTDGNGKRYVEEEDQPKYIIEVIKHIIDMAKKHRNDHFKNVPSVNQDSFRNSADEYITALKARQKELQS